MNTKYDNMVRALNNIIAPYNIDLSKTDFFEDILLIIGGIEEKSKGSHCGSNRATYGENCNFDLVISPESASALVLNLNSKFPELNAVDLTDPTSTQVINGYKARFIRVNCQAIQKHLLPIIEKELKSKPEMAVPYQNKYSFNEVASLLHKRFAPKGISLIKTACFEETVCYLVNHKLKSSYNDKVMTSIFKLFDEQKKLSDLAQTPTPNDFISKQEIVKQIKTESGHIESNPQDKWSTDLFITTPIEQAKNIVTYFNSILPNSAKIAETQQTLPNKKGLFTKITLDNKVLISPEFLDSINAALNGYTLDELDRYRVQSGTLSQKTSDMLTKLVQLATGFPKYSNNDYNNVAHELIESIKKLKAYFDTHSIVQSAPIDLIKIIHANRRILKGLITQDDALLANFQTNFDKPLKKSLQTIINTINDKFSPLADPYYEPRHNYDDNFLNYGPGMRC